MGGTSVVQRRAASTACATVGNSPMNPSPRLMPVTMVPPLAVMAPVMARSAWRARAR